MARNPRTKLAAIAFAAIATLGMIAASPATASHAGSKGTSKVGDHSYCC
jgi:hypothetical protein